MRKKQVVVIGSAHASKQESQAAYEIGKFIGGSGWVLITGGRSGVMEYASCGAQESGGLTVGILPDATFDAGNRYLDIIIPTGLGIARNAVNALAGDVIVAVGGGSGTLSEIGFAWQFGQPIICCSWIQGWSRRLAGEKIDNRRNDTCIKAKNLEHVKSLLMDILLRS